MEQRNTEAKGGNPFLKPARRAAYDAALETGKTRNEAMKIARRVPASPGFPSAVAAAVCCRAVASSR